MSFVSAQPQSIGVRGSGIAEQSTLTFRVTDEQARPVQGVSVTFSIVDIGGETIAPTQAVSDADGLVRTVLSSGTRTASVRIRAQVTAQPSIFSQSTAVSIFGAPPASDRFSMAAQFLNVSGRVTLGLEDTITAFLNDRFGNAVPAGTVVNFTTNGASIINATPTDANGRATAVLVTEGGSIPPDGIVRVLAVTRGEEPFNDTNGDGVWNQGETFTDVPEPFIDVNGNGKYDADQPFESFVDTNDNGVWDAAQGAGVWNDDALIWDVIAVTFSGSTTLSLQPASFTIPDGGSQLFTLTVTDDLGNPLVGGTQVSIAVDTPGKLVGIPSTFTLPDTETFGQLVNGVNRFSFLVVDNEPGTGDADKQIGVTVTVNSSGLPAGGNGSTSTGSVGVIQRVPPPTNTPTFTATPPPTATRTDTPPATATATTTSTGRRWIPRRRRRPRRRRSPRPPRSRRPRQPPRSRRPSSSSAPCPQASASASPASPSSRC